MSLYQAVGYVRPGGQSLISAQSASGGVLGSTLFITPRMFRYNTYGGPGDYNLTEQGLLAIFAYDPVYGTPPGVKYGDGGYRIVTKSDGTMDLIPFMQAMASICVYGTADAGQSLSTLQTSAKARKLEMQCGDTIAFVLGCAAQVGITARAVQCLTAETPNGSDDGHVMCEAKDATSKWLLVDVANNCMFKNPSGDHLSFLEVIDAGVANCIKVPLAEFGAANVAPTSSSYPARVVYELLLSNLEKTATWQQRIIQIPIIGGYAFMPTGTESRQSYVEGFGNTVETRSAWIVRNY